MARLPVVDGNESAAVAEVFQEIRSTRGFLSNALRAFGHSPEALRHFARVGAYAKYQSDLSERVRELVILCAGRGVPYEWTHHVPLALQVGIAQDVIDDIEAGRTPAALPPAEQAIVRFVAELFTPQSVGDAAFAEMQRHWSPRQITDVVVTVVYYRALGLAAGALGVQVEGHEVLETERKWQQGRS